MRKKSFIFLIIVMLLLFSACVKNDGEDNNDVEVIHSDHVSWESVEGRWLDYHDYSGDYVVEPIRDIDKNNIVPKEQIAIEFIQTAKSFLEYYPDETAVVDISYLEEKAYYVIMIYYKESNGDIILGGGTEFIVDAMTGEVIIKWGME